MSVDAIGTAATAQFMLAQIQKAELALDTSNRQVATGKVSDTYTGYADKTAMMEAARSVGALADANAAAAQQASTQLDLQDTQLSQLSQLANSVRQTLTSAAANQDGTSLMTQMQGYFDQAVGILNSQDANGAYVYGGDKNQTPPVSVTSLSALAALPSAAQAFANGSLKSSVRVGTTQGGVVGLLAADLGTQVFSLFQQVAQVDAGGSGPFNAATTPAQQNFLESTIQTSATAASDVNQQAAGNGMRYQMVQGTLTQLQATSTLYKGMVSDIEDVDMAHALAQLSQNQVALQASFQVTSKLNQLSLLNYLPPA